MSGQKPFKVEKHIGALDGIRAISIVLVVWFHLWQQNWITPYIHINMRALNYFGFTRIPIDTLVADGSLFVELIVFLSAFCNFLPYVRATVLGEKWPGTKEFYFKRFVRIVPSYLLAVVITFFISVFTGEYTGTSAGFVAGDVITHLTFTGPFFYRFFLASKIDVVLWTVEMEVIFYILMPFLAKLFKRFPVATYSIMCAVSFISTFYFVNNKAEMIRGYVNNPFTFFCVYANGYLFCTLYVMLCAHIGKNRYVELFSTMLSVICIVLIPRYFMIINAGSDFSTSQIRARFLLSLLFGTFTVSTCLSFGTYQKLFSNRLMRWICIISYNLYIWHQYIFVQMIKMHIPFYTGDENPAHFGDSAWQWKFTGLAVVNMLFVAILVTFAVEIPAKKLLEKKFGHFFMKQRVAEPIAESEDDDALSVEYQSDEEYEAINVRSKEYWTSFKSFLEKVKESAVVTLILKNSYLAGLILGIVTLAVSLPMFIRDIAKGFGRNYCFDTAYYFGMGKVLNSGYKLYTDYFDIKPPAMFRLCQLSYKLFKDYYAVELLDYVLICVVAIVPIVYLSLNSKAKNMKQKLMTVPSMWFAGSTVALYIHSRAGYSQIESFGAFFATAYILMISLRKYAKAKSGVWIALSSLVLMLAPLFKEPFAFVALAGALFFVDDVKDLVKKIILPFAIGGVIASLLMLIFGDLKNYISTYLKYMVMDVSGDGKLKNLFRIDKMIVDAWRFSPALFLLIFVCYAVVLVDGILLVRKKEKKWDTIIFRGLALLPGLALTSMAVGATGMYFDHHYIFAVPYYMALIIKSFSIVFAGKKSAKTKREIAAVMSFAALLFTVVFYNKYDMYFVGMYTDDGAMREDAEIVDRVLDTLDVDRYQFYGCNGDTVQMYTEHNPIGPIFLQDFTKIGKENWQGEMLLKQINSADVLVIQELNCNNLTEILEEIIARDFTEEVPQVISGKHNETNLCKMYFRKGKF